MCARKDMHAKSVRVRDLSMKSYEHGIEVTAFGTAAAPFRVTALDFSWRARSCRDMDKGWPHLDVLVHRHGIPGSLLVAQSSDDLMTAHTPKMYRPTSCHSKEKHQKWSPKDDPCVN